MLACNLSLPVKRSKSAYSLERVEAYDSHIMRKLTSVTVTSVRKPNAPAFVRRLGFFKHLFGLCVLSLTIFTKFGGVRSHVSSRALLSDNLEVLDAMLGPITFEVMEDPVMLMQDGKTYERSAIEQWFNVSKQNKSPLTGIEIKSKPTFLTNYCAIDMIKQYLEEKVRLCEDPTKKKEYEALIEKLSKVNHKPVAQNSAQGKKRSPEESRRANQQILRFMHHGTRAMQGGLPGVWMRSNVHGSADEQREAVDNQLNDDDLQARVGEMQRRYGQCQRLQRQREIQKKRQEQAEIQRKLQEQAEIQRKRQVKAKARRLEEAVRAGENTTELIRELNEEQMRFEIIHQAVKEAKADKSKASNVTSTEEKTKTIENEDGPKMDSHVRYGSSVLTGVLSLDAKGEEPPQLLNTQPAIEKSDSTIVRRIAKEPNYFLNQDVFICTRDFSEYAADAQTGLAIAARYRALYTRKIPLEHRRKVSECPAAGDMTRLKKGDTITGTQGLEFIKHKLGGTNDFHNCKADSLYYPLEVYPKNNKYLEKVKAFEKVEFSITCELPDTKDQYYETPSLDTVASSVEVDLEAKCSQIYVGLSKMPFRLVRSSNGSVYYLRFSDVTVTGCEL